MVNGLLLCPECAFDAQYGPYEPAKGRPDPQDYLRPRFAVRKVG